MSLSTEIEKLKFDKRLTEWHVSRGRMTQAELDNHLKNLPDCGQNMEVVDLPENDFDPEEMNGHQ